MSVKEANNLYDYFLIHISQLNIKPDNPDTVPFSPNGNNLTVSSTTLSEGINYPQYDQTPLRRSGHQLVTGEEATLKRLQNLYKTVYYFRAVSCFLLSSYGHNFMYYIV